MKAFMKWVFRIFAEAFQEVKPEDISVCENIPTVIATLAWANN